MPEAEHDETPGGRRCATCVYGWGVRGGGSLLVRLECRRYPPQSGTEIASFWYPVSPHDWCGEWCEFPAEQG